MDHRSLRLLRGWSGALVATALAAASHGLADGSLPRWPLMVLILAVSGTVCTALAGRRLSMPRLAAAVVLSQGIFHAAFGLAGHGDAPGLLQAEGTSGAHGASHHGTALALQYAGTAGTASGAADLRMLSLHLVAAVLTVAVLGRGELAVRAIARTLRLAVPLAVLAWEPAPVVVPLRRPETHQVPGLPDLGVPLRALRHRGPPACPAS